MHWQAAGDGAHENQLAGFAECEPPDDFRRFGKKERLVFRGRIGQAGSLGRRPACFVEAGAQRIGRSNQGYAPQRAPCAEPAGKIEAGTREAQLDSKRDEAWKQYEQAAKDIESRKDGLMDEVEKRLKQQVSEQSLFTIRWQVK